MSDIHIVGANIYDIHGRVLLACYDQGSGGFADSITRPEGEDANYFYELPGVQLPDGQADPRGYLRLSLENDFGLRTFVEHGIARVMIFPEKKGDPEVRYTLYDTKLKKPRDADKMRWRYVDLGSSNRALDLGRYAAQLHWLMQNEELPRS